MIIALYNRSIFSRRLDGRTQLAIGLATSVAALAGLGLGRWLFYRLRKAGQSLLAPAAAFAGEGAHVDSFVHTRDAGPDHIRDEDGEDWDKIDQSSDESFPSSDPPAQHDFRTPEPIHYPEDDDLEIAFARDRRVGG